MLMNKLYDTDPEIYETILNELNRIENGVELIPSENFISRSVMQVITQCIALVLMDYRDKALQVRVKEDLAEFVGAFPLYPGLTVLE